MKFLLNSYLFAVCVIKHTVHDVLGQFGFVGVSSSAHPGVNDALIVCALKWYLQKTYTVRQKPKRNLFWSSIKQYKSKVRDRKKLYTCIVIIVKVLKKKNHNLENEAKL